MHVFEQLKDILAGYCVADVAEKAAVCPATIYFWLDGTTQKPRMDTVIKVARAVGWEISLKRRRVQLRRAA